tara:strand:+ start:26 stop:700 length:675 start_codon:yes stop_codon:yes gene_type:complete
MNKKRAKSIIDNLEKNNSLSLGCIEFAPNIYLKIGRIHEICGPAKTRVAILVGAKTKGLIVWIRPDWENSIINTDSISNWFSPNQLLLINAKNKNDILFATEEVLRSGLSEVTITELPVIPSALQMRRIRLAITSGVKLNNTKKPLGLILSPNEGGATNIESRWYASTLPCWYNLTNKENDTLNQKWYLKRLFSKTDPIKQWSIETVGSNKKNMPPKLLSLPIT